MFDQRVNLYGTAALGAVDGNGVVYSLTPPETDTCTVDRICASQVSGTAGWCRARVFPGLSFSGDLFGTTEEGGAHNMGTVFQVRPPSEPSGNAKGRVLYSFGSVAA